MKGKHMKTRKKRKFKIVDKSKFIRMIAILILILLSIVCLIIHGISTKDNEIKPIGTIQTENINISAERNIGMIDRVNEIKITSRGGVTRDKAEKNVEQEIKTTILENPVTMYVIANNGVNVRETFNSNSNKVKSLAYSNKVVVTEKFENWGKIGDNQWVCLDYFSETKPKVIENKKPQTTKTPTPSTTSASGYIAFTATGYCPCAKCCGKTTGITASGAKATAGVTVAMSSKYSFGTKVEIKGMGVYTVQDRGGAIQGNKIDIFFNTHQEALNFGRRTVYLKVL